MTPPDPDLLYKVAYDEAVRALVEQQSAIDSLLELASWLATVCFIGVASVSLVILWPRRWEFEADPGDMITAYVDVAEPVSVGRLCRDLSLHMHDSYIENRGGLRQLATFFQTAICLLTAEVILWVLALGFHM